MKKILCSTLLLSIFFNVYSQVGINTTTPNAALEINSNNQGLLIPRVALTMTTIQAPVINPTAAPLVPSTLVYNTNTAGDVTPGYYYWDGSIWVRLGNGISDDWALLGNTSITTPATPVTYDTSLIGAAENFLGTNDANDLVLGTNRIERFRLKQTTGRIGIGTATPSYRLHVIESNTNSVSRFTSSYVGNTHTRAIYADANNNPGYGYAGQFNGGYVGLRSYANSSSHAGWSYSIYATTSGTSPSGSGRVGAWIDASGGQYNRGVIVPGTTAGIRNGFGTTGPEQMVSIAEGVNLDQSSLNNGTLTSGLSFGSGSGEGIGSKRTTGGNQYGLDFYQGFSNRMRIWNNGNVAIGTRSDGTQNPDANLCVIDPTTANTDVQVFSARKGGTAGSRWRMGSVEYYTEGLDNVGFSSYVSPLDGHGMYALGFTTGTNYDGYRWLRLYATNASDISSDIRLKEEIKPLEYGLETIKNIETISYKMKDQYYPNGQKRSSNDKEVSIGFNAQQLRELVPEVVSYKSFETIDENEYLEIQQPTYGVRYAELIPVTVNAIKDLDTQQQTIIETINITDFGVESKNSNTIKVSFTSDFINKLNSTPVITITSLDGNIKLQLKNVTNNGFEVENLSSTNSTSFNWIAIAKIKKETLAVKPRFDEQDRKAKVAKMYADEKSLPTVQDLMNIRNSMNNQNENKEKLTSEEKASKELIEKNRIESKKAGDSLLNDKNRILESDKIEEDSNQKTN